MKIIEPSVELLWITPTPELVIERAGRTCYKSEDRITPDSANKFIKMIMSKNHESVIEHASACFKIITDRGITHELVRHRIASFSQESTRYCNYGKEKFNNEISVIEPPGLTTEARENWITACEFSEKTYLHMLDLGVSPQIARSILPTCLKTEIVVTANFREWRHIIDLRTSQAAHPQIRQVIQSVAIKLQELSPTIFGKETNAS